jgi:hypothetical protein
MRYLLFIFSLLIIPIFTLSIGPDNGGGEGENFPIIAQCIGEQEATVSLEMARDWGISLEFIQVDQNFGITSSITVRRYCRGNGVMCSGIRCWYHDGDCNSGAYCYCERSDGKISANSINCD